MAARIKPASDATPFSYGTGFADSMMATKTLEWLTKWLPVGVGMTNINVLEFTDLGSFLSGYGELRRRKDPKWSFKRWSEDIGLSKAIIPMVIRGKRSPGPQVVAKLVEYFKFSDIEREYFLNLIALNRFANNPSMASLLMAKLAEVRPDRTFRSLDLETFKLISQWYYGVLKEMVKLEGFVDDVEWIQKMLCFPVKQPCIRDAIVTLLKLDLLERDAEGRLRNRYDTVVSTDGVPSEAIKQYHEQMIQMGLESVRKFSVEERILAARTLGVKRGSLNVAHRLLKQFETQLAQVLDKDPSDVIYQLNVQFFPLTQIHDPSFSKG